MADRYDGSRVTVVEALVSIRFVPDAGASKARMALTNAMCAAGLLTIVTIPRFGIDVSVAGDTEMKIHTFNYA